MFMDRISWWRQTPLKDRYDFDSSRRIWNWNLHFNHSKILVWEKPLWKKFSIVLIQMIWDEFKTTNTIKKNLKSVRTSANSPHRQLVRDDASNTAQSTRAPHECKLLPSLSPFCVRKGGKSRIRHACGTQRNSIARGHNDAWLRRERNPNFVTV